MSIQERDYILRLIQQLIQTLARIAGLKAAGKLDDARRLVRETVDGLVGPLRGTLDSLDARGVAAVLGSGDKLAAYAALIAEEGAIFELEGEVKQGRVLCCRALDLYRAAAAAGGLSEDAKRRVDEGIQGLSAKLSAPRAGGL